jgi:hypothetical protein
VLIEELNVDLGTTDLRDRGVLGAAAEDVADPPNRETEDQHPEQEGHDDPSE